jgi:NAD(P)-dependent dehydrogenase (short-subunit alcohol dehydrogenase family)
MEDLASRRKFLLSSGLVLSGLFASNYPVWAEAGAAEKNRIASWSASDIPSQAGRSVIVTGGTSGIGFEDALALARAHADVIVASRDEAAGAATVDKIRQAIPDAKIRFELFDLDSLASISDFCSRVRSKQESLDLLINNAGVLGRPERVLTQNGFETVFATNYLGHFALTAQLLPLLKKGHGTRVVTISAVTAGRGAIDFDNLQGEKNYDSGQAYLRAKLAELIFALEFHRRSEAGKWGIASMAAHPGVSNTNLFISGPGEDSAAARNLREHPENYQPAAQGALPTLYAATSPDAKGGQYFGPNDEAERAGPPGYAKIPPQALDLEVAKRLWTVSEKLTGTSFS